MSTSPPIVTLPSLPVPVASGGTGATTLNGAGLLTKQAATAVAGYTLINGTGTIISWAVPNDGALHRVQVYAGMDVTSAATGGAISMSVTLPDGTVGVPTLFPGSAGSGFDFSENSPGYIVKAGSTVIVEQFSALTLGAAVFWAEIWGS